MSTHPPKHVVILGGSFAGLTAAFKGRPVGADVVERIAEQIEELARRADPPITTEEIGRAVLDHLRAHDQVAYLRFASVYKGFDDPRDFEREIGLLKATAPKAH